jgi:hypothetical protein
LLCGIYGGIDRRPVRLRGLRPAARNFSPTVIQLTGTLPILSHHSFSYGAERRIDMFAMQIHKSRLPLEKTGLVLIAVGAIALASFGAWFQHRSHALAIVPTGEVIDPSQIHSNDLPTQKFSDFSLIFD